MANSSSSGAATPSNRLVDNSASVAKWTLVSRVTGFIRVILISGVFGATYFGNLFQIANQLPWMLFELTIGVLLGAILIPRLMPHVERNDRAAVERLANGTIGVVIAAFGLVALAAMMLGPLAARLFALGVEDPVERADFVRAAIPLILLTAPQLVGYGIAATGQAIQQSLGQFALPAAASIVENVAVIATMIIFWLQYGTGVPLADAGMGHLLLLGGGSSLGVACHAALQWWGVRRLGIKLRPTAGWRDQEVRSMVRTALPASGTSALNGGRFLVLNLAANTVPGGVVALNLALNVFSLPVALGAKPAAYAVMPKLSALWAARNEAAFGEEYSRALGLAGLVTVPFAAAVASLGWFGAPIVAFGDMNTAFGRQLLALAVVAVSGAIVGETIHQIGISGSFARHDARSPLTAYALRFVVLCLGIGAALLIADGAIAILLIGIAMSSADIVSGLFLHHKIVAALPSHNYALWRSLRSTGVAALLAFGTAGALAAAVAPYSQTRSTRTMASALIGVMAIVVYGVIRSRADNELRAFVSGFRRKEPSLA